MARKVEVQLILEVTKYNAQAKEAAVAARDLRDKVGDLGKAAEEAAHATGTLGDRSTRTAKDMVVLKAEMNRVEAELRDLAREYERTGDAALLSAFKSKQAELSRLQSVQRTVQKLNAAAAETDTSKSMDTLRNEIQKVENELKKLASEYERTGSVAVATSIRQRQSVLRDLRTLEIEAKKAAGGLIPNVTSGGIGSVFSAVGGLPFKGMLIGALVAAAAAAAPAIGAGVGAAVLGAAGTGGMVGGIIAASRDPGVIEAARGFGANLSREFFGSGAAFVKPLEDSLHELSHVVLNLHLADSFKIMAPFVTEIAKGLGGLVTRFMPGFNAALKAAGPVLHEFANDLPEIGAALGYMFQQIGKGKGNVEGMRLIMGGLGMTLHAIGNLVRNLSDAWDAMLKRIVFAADILANAPVIGRFFQGLDNDMRNLQDPANKTVAVFSQIKVGAESTVNPNLAAAQSIAGVAKEYRGLQDLIPVGGQTWRESVDSMTTEMGKLNESIAEGMQAFTDMVNAALGIEDVNIQIARGWREILGLAKENGRTLDINTEAGDRNREKILAQVGAYERLREQTISQGGDIVAANKKYEDQLNLLEQALDKEKFNKAAVHEIVDEFRGIPKKITTDLVVDIKLIGANKLNPNLMAALAGGGKAVIQFSGIGGDKELAPKHAAGGGNDPGWNWYGERGPELHWNAVPGFTLTAAQSAPFLAPPMPWHGGPSMGGGSNRTITIIVKDTTGRTLRRELVSDAQDRGVSAATIRAVYP